MPEKFKKCTSDIIEIIEQHQIESHVQKYKKRKKAKLNQDTLLDPEFKKFWNKISQKTIYSVHYDSKDLVAKAGLAVKNMPAISPVRLITHQADYNPDWAILKKNGGIVYMIRETKGTLNPRALRSLEQDKTKYGAKHFESLGVDYKTATSVEDGMIENKAE